MSQEPIFALDIHSLASCQSPHCLHMPSAQPDSLPGCRLIEQESHRLKCSQLFRPNPRVQPLTPLNALLLCQNDTNYYRSFQSIRYLKESISDIPKEKGRRLSTLVSPIHISVPPESHHVFVSG